MDNDFRKFGIISKIIDKTISKMGGNFHEINSTKLKILSTNKESFK